MRKDGALFGPAQSIAPHQSLKAEAERKEQVQNPGHRRLSCLHSNERTTPFLGQDDYKLKYQTKMKEGLPKKGEAPVVGMRSNKNFITANAVEAILQGLSAPFPPVPSRPLPLPSRPLPPRPANMT